MRKLVIFLLIAAPFAIPAASAQARAIAQETATTGQDPITVTGDDRLICRRVTRTATRMGTGRICRTMAQWRREAPGSAAANDPNGSIEGAADTLTTSGEKVSTGCTGGMGGGHNGPLGPR